MSDTPPTTYLVIDTSVGELLLTATPTALTRLLFARADASHDIDPLWRDASGARDASDASDASGSSDSSSAPNHAPRAAVAILHQTRTQLAEYFAGTRQTFDVPLDPVGTPFQQRVWLALREIPYGVTISYGTLANRIGNPRAVRAVGLANGRNPISIIVPCHRVIGASGQLTGYGGGLDRKRYLLELERAINPPAPALPLQPIR